MRKKKNKYHDDAVFKWQRIKDAHGNRYKDDMEETANANPDTISDEGSYKELVEQRGQLERFKDVSLRWRRRRINRLIKEGTLDKVLSTQQKKIFNLLMTLHKTPSEIAVILEVTQQSVDTQVKRLSEKIKTYVL